jgi:4'-phosphopantetheinyl transferase
MRPLLPDTILFQHSFVRETESPGATFCLSRCRPEWVEEARSQFLTEAEELAWRRFPFKRRQRSYLLGRYCAKEAVACQASLASLTEFQIDVGVFQQPVVRGPGTSGIQVSITHSEGWGAALAFDERHPMGIDLERVGADRNDTIRSQLTARELSAVAASPLHVDAALALAWTLKEALSKTIRTGLTTPLTIFETSKLSWDTDALACEFSSFGQYRGLAFVISGFALGLVLPRLSGLGCPFQDFRARFARLAQGQP